jgi:hypothetical protein
MSLLERKESQYKICRGRFDHEFVGRWGTGTRFRTLLGSIAVGPTTRGIVSLPIPQHLCSLDTLSIGERELDSGLWLDDDIGAQ